MKRFLYGLVIIAGLLATIATISNTVAAQATPGQPIAGISCDAMEGQRVHTHQHLAIFDHGKPLPIPPTVGIPAGMRCLYWLHTHTPDGVIHVEAPLDRVFTLGDFFSIWGEPLTDRRASTASAKTGEDVKVFVNGKPFTADPRTIKLEVHTDIVIQVGPPFGPVPVFKDWQGR
jgi:hypothetical protein